MSVNFVPDFNITCGNCLVDYTKASPSCPEPKHPAPTLEMVVTTDEYIKSNEHLVMVTRTHFIEYAMTHSFPVPCHVGIACGACRHDFERWLADLEASDAV